MDETERLAALIKQRIAIDDEIAQLIGRPAQIGHVGEWLAQAIFDVKLELSATQAGYDGCFAVGPLTGKTVNVKWYAKREGLLDINPAHGADYYLVFAGPKTAAMSSRGATRPWVIAEVFLFDMPPLIERLQARGVKIGIATSVRLIEWEAARIYPEQSPGAVLRPTAEQARLLSLFGLGKREIPKTKIYLPSPGPEAWKQFLADPVKHWKTGYSARTLAHAWEAADGVPPEIAQLLAGAAGFQGEVPVLLLAIPEHKVPLPGRGPASQNDVFALVRIGDRTISATIEGKVNEPFGPTVGEWLKDASPGKQERMAFLCRMLGISDPPPAEIHYQLLHRAASAVIETKRFGTDAAAMIVHSFSPERMWFDAFERFTGLYGLGVRPGQLVEVSLPTGMPLFLGWACGHPRFLEA